MDKLESRPELLRASSAARPIGVDRKNNVLRGYVIAQLGILKDRRGEFDQLSLDAIVELGNKVKQGLKSRFSHPTECDSGLGKFLGRARDLYMSEATTRDGQRVPAVRGDLHFDRTALEMMPDGGKPLGIYVMDLAENDSDALSSSIVVRMKREYRLKPDGTKMTDEKGEELPPLLRPVALWASDVVDDGAACDGLLSVGDLPNAHLWKAAEMLNDKFPDATREELSATANEWLDRYLDMRFGVAEVPPTPAPAAQPAPAQPAQPELLTLLLRQRQRELESLT